MKTNFMILSSFFLIGCFYACDNNNSLLDENQVTPVSTRSVPDPNNHDMSHIPDDGGAGNFIENCFFSGDSFSYKMQRGSVVFTLSYDKTKRSYPLISFIKFTKHYNTKYELFKYSIRDIQYDTNNNLQSFQIVIQYDVYKNKQKPGKSTEYYYYYYETPKYILKYTRQ